MSHNFEKELTKTSVSITFPDDAQSYACYYNPSSDKTYYAVNGEFLMIVNPQKVREVKDWYEDQKRKRHSDEEE